MSKASSDCNSFARVYSIVSSRLTEYNVLVLYNIHPEVIVGNEDREVFLKMSFAHRIAP